MLIDLVHVNFRLSPGLKELRNPGAMDIMEGAPDKIKFAPGELLNLGTTDIS